ncbi:hypothetical protein [Marinovum sp.]|uniref:hypothetical protein n=1 Tax=Marinovum sp. TaxID=2024839 RepID=UPI002B26A47D|nr:hypothetical protein [Marinovum sp.]
MLRSAALSLMLFAAPALARDLPLSCAGEAPGWRLDLLGPVAVFHFPARTEMEVRLTTPAEGRDWPIAKTLTGPRDTAIVVLQERACVTGHGSFPIEAQVLTQRGTTPILLTGCCAVVE